MQRSIPGLSVAGILTLVAFLCPRDAAAQSARGDFNGDGIADLAVGVPREDGEVIIFHGGPIGGPLWSLRRLTDSGAVNVLYGSADGLTGTGSQFLNQGRGQDDDEHFGAALAAGDFNGDGYSDLAVGTPGDGAADGGLPGSISVFYGSAGGLQAGAAQTFLARNFLVSGMRLSFTEDMAMIAADFNGGSAASRADDLAVSATGFDPVAGAPAGCERSGVLILGGAKDTVLSDARRSFLTIFGCGFRTEITLAAGALSGQDDKDDLVVGGRRFLEEIHIHRGTAEFGVAAVEDDPARVLNQGGGNDDTDICLDDFGATLAVGDFNGDGRADLAVGAPAEDLGGCSGPGTNAGAVSVFFGGGSEIEQGNAQLLTQNTSGLPADVGDAFGSALAAGDFNGDGFFDLAIGVPSDRVGTKTGAGTVHVIYGDLRGLSAESSGGHPAAQLWHGDLPGINGSADTGARYGLSLSAAGFGKGPEDDLVIGVPFEVLPVARTSSSGQVTIENVVAGSAHALYGSSSGLTTAGSQVWHQNSTGVPDSVENGDQFGHVVR